MQITRSPFSSQAVQRPVMDTPAAHRLTDDALAAWTDDALAAWAEDLARTWADRYGIPAELVLAGINRKT